MTNTKPTAPFKAALAALPSFIAEGVLTATARHGGVCDEIHLIRGGQAYIVAGGKNVRTGILCTDEDIKATLMELLGHSLYAHSESMREGYIFTSSGLRVGVAGQAFCRGDVVEVVGDIRAVTLRIPHRHPGVADRLYSYVVQKGTLCSMLIWSPPGVGKTTLLRELSLLLSEGDTPFRTAVVDTRCEITAGIQGEMMDVFLGYPRAVGMEIALRTMSPQVIVCDEIANAGDADAVLSAAASGVAVLASAHAGRREDLLLKKDIARLIEAGAFSTLVGLHRVGSTVRCSITDREGREFLCCAL